jgi:hypothetical protein
VVTSPGCAQSLTEVVGEVRDTGEYLSKRVNQLVTDAATDVAACVRTDGLAATVIIGTIAGLHPPCAPPDSPPAKPSPPRR